MSHEVTDPSKFESTDGDMEIIMQGVAALHGWRRRMVREHGAKDWHLSGALAAFTTAQDMVVQVNEDEDG